MYEKEKIIEAFEPLLGLGAKEDFPLGDITSEAIFKDDSLVCSRLFAKAEGVLCGLDLLIYALEKGGKLEKKNCFKKDGDMVEKGELVLEVFMPKKGFLKYERIGLNIVQHLSGIATKTRRFVEELSASKTKLLDTRKTLPGYRFLQKYAVFVGGGKNHRMGLSDMFLIKDNHIKAAGGISKAVERVREYALEKGVPKTVLIEVECKDLDEVREASSLLVDVIMLDNMGTREMKEAMLSIDSRVKVEISGNVAYERLKELRDLGADFVSAGSLTHSVEALDFSMKIVEN